MPRKSTKKTPKPVRPQLGDGVEILNAGSVLEAVSYTHLCATRNDGRGELSADGSSHLF